MYILKFGQEFQFYFVRFLFLQSCMCRVCSFRITISILWDKEVGQQLIPTMKFLLVERWFYIMNIMHMILIKIKGIKALKQHRMMSYFVKEKLLDSRQAMGFCVAEFLPRDPYKNQTNRIKNDIHPCRYVNRHKFKWILRHVSTIRSFYIISEYCVSSGSEKNVMSCGNVKR